MIDEDDSRDRILTMVQEMDPCQDSWTIEIVTAIVLHSVVAEVTTMTLGEVGDEVTLMAVAEAEEAEEGEEWEVEDSKTVAEEVEAAVEVEEEEDFLKIEVVDRTLEEGAEVAIDENPFELWTTCHQEMVNERDLVNCRHEETGHEIFLGMDQ